MDHFPRGCAFWRAASRAADFVTRFAGVVIMGIAFLVVGTFFSIGSHPTVASRIGFGVVVVGLALLLVYGSAFVWYGLSYRLAGYRDPDWEPMVVSNGGRTATCALRCKRQPPLDPGVLGALGAWVRRPSGDYYVPKPHNITPDLWFHLPGQPPEAGTYEVRWYGRSARNKRYEITRQTVAIDLPREDDSWQVVPVGAVEQ